MGIDLSIVVLTCVLAVVTPSGGQICVKSDGTVSIPDAVSIDEASRLFWERMAASYPDLCVMPNRRTQP